MIIPNLNDTIATSIAGFFGHSEVSDQQKQLAAAIGSSVVEYIVAYVAAYVAPIDTALSALGKPIHRNVPTSGEVTTPPTTTPTTPVTTIPASGGLPGLLKKFFPPGTATQIGTTPEGEPIYGVVQINPTSTT